MTLPSKSRPARYRSRTRRPWIALALMLGLAAPAVAQRAARRPAPATTTRAAVGESDGATAPRQDPRDAARRARVVIEAGEVKLTLGEVEDDLRRRSPFMRRQFSSAERLVEHAREMFRAKLLAHAAAERGYGERPDVREEIDKHLVALVVRHQIDDTHGPDTVSEEEARRYFTEHQEQFGRPEQRRASHILLPTRERAMELLAQLREGDLRAFRLAAMAESLDARTKQRGGDLGYFDAEGRITGASEPSVDESIRNAVFGLSREQPIVSEPVAVPAPGDGDETHYSIIRMTGLRAGAEASFENVELAIRRRIARANRDAAYRELVARLRERGQVRTTNLELLRTISLPPPPMPQHHHRGPERDGEEGEESDSASMASMDGMPASPPASAE